MAVTKKVSEKEPTQPVANNEKAAKKATKMSETETDKPLKKASSESVTAKKEAKLNKEEIKPLENVKEKN